MDEVPFLDVLVNNAHDNSIVTDLYTKPTDTHMYLHPDSCHPGHIKRSIAYSQARRILSICSSRDTALLRLESVVGYFTSRGHSESKVRREIRRAVNLCDITPTV